MTRLSHALCIWLSFSTTLIAFSQSPQGSENRAVVQLGAHQSTEPVAITAIKVNGHEVGTSTFPILPGEQWLKNVSVIVTNKTSQVVNGIDLELLFPETGSGSRDSPVVGYQCQIGSTPASRTNASTHGQSAPIFLAIAPNSNAELDLGKYSTEYSKLLFSRMGSVNPHQVRLVITLIDFANSVEWGGNAFFSISPTGTSTPVDSKEMF